MDTDALLTLTAAACALASLVVLRRLRRRAATRVLAAELAWTAPQPQRAAPATAAPSIEAAERELALLLPRMRAYLRDPYDVEASRIRGDDEFERCLDLAARLRERIAAFGGAAVADDPEARHRLRRQILKGLLAERGAAG